MVKTFGNFFDDPMFALTLTCSFSQMASLQLFTME